MGQTHLAGALGIEAIRKGYKTLFITTQSLLTQLAKAHSENRLEEKLRFFNRTKLLIIDEIGYIPLDRHGANLFFQLVAKRYEQGALILTSNQSYSDWGEVFGDQVLATTILAELVRVISYARRYAVQLSIFVKTIRVHTMLVQMIMTSWYIKPIHYYRCFFLSIVSMECSLSLLDTY